MRPLEVPIPHLKYLDPTEAWREGRGLHAPRLGALQIRYPGPLPPNMPSLPTECQLSPQWAPHLFHTPALASAPGPRAGTGSLQSQCNGGALTLPPWGSALRGTSSSSRNRDGPGRGQAPGTQPQHPMAATELA